MNRAILQTHETTPEAYERRLVPTLFEPWTHRVAGSAQVREGQRVLDVACGTGILARTVAARVGSEDHVAGVDINDDMLSVARRIAPGIDWRQGPAERLPFDDGAFDAVVSQFGLMFFSDHVAALREMMRTLRPGGRLAVAVFDSLDHAPAYSAMVTVLRDIVGDVAADALRMPFALGDTGELATLFQEAGVPGATIASEKVAVSFPGVRDMVLADVEGWFPMAGIEVDGATLDALVTRAQMALLPFVGPRGKVEFPLAAHVVSATRP